MWIFFDAVVFAAGYVASIYSWAKIKIWINGASVEAADLRQKAAQLEDKTSEPVMLPRWRVDSFIVVAACAPVVGIVMAVYSREPAWLFLCFALTLFL